MPRRVITSLSVLAGVAALLLTAPAAAPAEMAVGKAGKLHATSKHAFAGQDGAVPLNGPNLQPVWSPDGEDTWGQDTYDAIKQKGFTATRFVLFWDDFEPQQGKWNETAFGTLSKAIDRAQSAGLYVVLDCVHLVGQPEGQSRVPQWARKADGLTAVADNGAGFLQQIAERYGENTTVAAYDPVNEPYPGKLDHRKILAGYTKIVDVIRAKDAATNIVLEPAYGDARPSVADFEAFKPGSRENLVWSIHNYYPGGAGDGYKPDGSGHVPNLSDGETGYDPANKADLAAHLKVQLDLAREIKMPLWIGEFGIGAKAPGHDQYIKDAVALYKANGVDYSWWEYFGNDGVFSMVDSDGNWKPWVDLLR